MGGVGIAYRLEAFDGFGDISKAGVEIADCVVDREILGIMLQDFVVLSNGVLQLALLDKLLGGAEKLLFVKAKTKRHRIADSSLFPLTPALFCGALPNGLYTRREIPGETPQTAQTASRSKVIVRPGTPSPMVTNDYWGYQKGVYVRFRKNSARPQTPGDSVRLL